MTLTFAMTKILVRGSLLINANGAIDAVVPDVIQGMQKEWREDLGHARMRDPDALPPNNAFEWIMNALYRACSEMVQGNSLFAIKAGVLTSWFRRAIAYGSNADHL